MSHKHPDLTRVYAPPDANTTSYAVASLRSGDDIKTVQGNLGHATAAFTLDVYGHVTNQMREASAIRLEAYIKGILEL